MQIRLATLLVLTLSVSCAQTEQKVPANYREEMIPMRDGVRLQTVIVAPSKARGALPIVLERTPYGVAPRDAWKQGVTPNRIRVVQNLRGRFKSEGQWVMQRPPHTSGEPKGIDETTDAYDTVEWLVRNVPNNNGRVAITGTSYNGWTAVMAALDPHPAVKAIIEQASPADMFLGDDFHHNGAFRLSYGFEYASLLETTAAENYHFQFSRSDTYDWYLELGSLRNADALYFKGKIPTWRDFVEHPNYDEFWKRQTVIRYLKEVKVPMLHVAGWWDQEDFYGPQKIYAALEPADAKHLNYFVAGPWNHGGWGGDGSSLGPISFGSDTAKYYRESIAQKWLDHWLLDTGKLDLAEATTFETGTNQWRSYETWPPTKGVTMRRLYLQPGRRLSFEKPTAGGTGYDEYVSDPDNPVPYRPRPVPPTYPGAEWPVWLVQDQRFADHRPDVLSWATEPLTGDVRIAGKLEAELFASTSGTDSDWVVKLIDVYPDNEPKLGGYQLMIASEILRGRFHKSFEHPEPLPSDSPVAYSIGLHTNDHVFLKGHRIMVQVQSTWFPLYDRNPQHFVPNIFNASASDYRKATQRVYRTPDKPSAIVLPVLD
jgi:putative CocE/NonD family hydrolase